MKHAYLIIAHNEFEILEKLIACLDDERNDIFVHIDRKVKQLPELKTRYANLIVLQERVDVRWGHVSQIECEYKLFEVAYKSGTYSRFHLLSGTHLPLKTQDEIHTFFQQYPNTEFLLEMGKDAYQATFKIGVYHFFLRWYRHSSPLVARLSQIAWFKTVKLQEKLGIDRNTDRFKRKASNWVNLTPKAVEYILEKKTYILQRFRYTFCGDEYFVPHLLDNADEPFNINYSSTCCYYDFGDQSNPRILTMTDYEHLTEGEYLFARKFSTSEINFVNKILERIQPQQ